MPCRSATSDPILGHDVSFYVFQLPFLQFVQNLLFMTVLLAAIGVAAAHVAGQSLMFDPGTGSDGRATRRGAT